MINPDSGNQNPPRRVSQADIAKACRVSRTAVAFALNPKLSSRLNQETLTLITKTAQELGYRPHRQAQIMRGVKSGVLGVIQFGGSVGFGAERIRAIASAIHEAGYQIHTSDAVWRDNDVASACANMVDAQVEGVLLVCPSMSFPQNELNVFQHAGIPVVSLAGIELEGIPQVRADSRQGLFDLTKHLLTSGRRNLALLVRWPTAAHDQPRCWPTRERIAGFQEAIEESGGVFHQEPISNTSKSPQPQGFIVPAPADQDARDPHWVGHHAVTELIAHQQSFDALLCSNDDWALGALAAAVEARLDVPKTLAITGFDDARYARYGAIPLTTVAQPIEKMARLAITNLITLTRGESLSPEQQRISLPCQLKIRQSCGAGAIKMRDSQSRFGIKSSISSD